MEIVNVVEISNETCCNIVNIVGIYMKQCLIVNATFEMSTSRSPAYVWTYTPDLQDARWCVLVCQDGLVHCPRVLLGDVDRMNTILEQQWMTVAQGRARGLPPLHVVVAVVTRDRLRARLPSVPTQSLVNGLRVAREFLRRAGHTLDTGDDPHEHH